MEESIENARVPVLHHVPLPGGGLYREGWCQCHLGQLHIVPSRTDGFVLVFFFFFF